MVNMGMMVMITKMMTMISEMMTMIPSETLIWGEKSSGIPTVPDRHTHPSVYMLMHPFIALPLHPRRVSAVVTNSFVM